MNIREALLTMSPSLVLHRAASDEIARLDAQVLAKSTMIQELLVQVQDLQDKMEEKNGTKTS